MLLDLGCLESPFSVGSEGNGGFNLVADCAVERHFGRCFSISEVAVTDGAARRTLGNGFGPIWRVDGNPYRGPTFSSCCDVQRRVPELAPASPLR